MTSSKRLFIALWPDVPCRNEISKMQELAAINSGLMTGAVAYENLHMTLQFLGEVPVSAVPVLKSQLGFVSAMPFHISLDRWGHFAKSGILWLGSSSQDNPLQELQAGVVKATARAQYTDRKRMNREKVYKPHVTLFRKVDHLPRLESFDPIEWLIDRLVLVESTMHPDGVKYKILQEYLF